MADQDQDAPGTIESLQGLIESPGWAWFIQQVEQAWGAEACIRKIDAALAELTPGDRPAETETVLQIRAAARQIHVLIASPAKRIAELTQSAAPPTGRFAALRRAGG